MPPKLSLRQKLNALKPKISEKTKKDDEFQNNVAKFHEGQRGLKQIQDKITNAQRRSRVNQNQVYNRYSSVMRLQQSLDLTALRQITRRVASDQRVLDLLRTENDISERQLAFKIEQILLANLQSVSGNTGLFSSHQFTFSTSIPAIFITGQPLSTVQFIFRQIMMRRGFTIRQTQSDESDQMEIVVITNQLNSSQTDIDTQITFIENQHNTNILPNRLNVGQANDDSRRERNAVPQLEESNDAIQTHQQVQSFFRRYSQSINNEEQRRQAQNTEQGINGNGIPSSNVNNTTNHSQQQQKQEVNNKDNQEDQEKVEKHSESKSQYLEKQNQTKLQMNEKQPKFEQEKNCIYPLRNRKQNNKE